MPSIDSRTCIPLELASVHSYVVLTSQVQIGDGAGGWITGNPGDYLVTAPNGKLAVYTAAQFWNGFLVFNFAAIPHP